MDHEGTGDPRFTYAPKGLDAASLGAVLQVVGNVILDRGRRGELQMFPCKEQKVPKVVNSLVHAIQPCPLFRLGLGKGESLLSLA